MKTIIEINVDASGNCRYCGYAVKIPVPYLNSFAARWKCVLFNEFISDIIDGFEQPRQCGECRQLINRHYKTPELQE